MSHTEGAQQPGESASHDRGLGFGKPGNAKDVKRTIKVTALDSMKFDPPALTVRAGETIRFVVANKGQLQHEFVIGDPATQREHAEHMKSMPNMAMNHADHGGNAVSLKPGQTKTLVWKFDKDGVIEIACHIPGHYEAGMVSKVTVRSEQKASQNMESERHKH